MRGFLDDWFRLASFPFEWWSRCRGDDIPVVGILLEVGDRGASTKGPYNVMTPYCVPGAVPQVTPLIKMNNPGLSLSAHRVEATLWPDGNTLSVSLISPRGVPALADGDAGYYVGMVWANDPPERRPLAILNVYAYVPAP